MSGVQEIRIDGLIKASPRSEFKFAPEKIKKLIKRKRESTWEMTQNRMVMAPANARSQAER
jgi:hypothetical protein